MSRHSDYEKRTEELAKEPAKKLGLTIYDVEYVKEGTDMYLRIYIDKPGGVDINDCESLSGIMNPVLDAEDFIDEAYIFEVSSPGLGRTLKKDRHFSYSIGEKCDVKLFSPEDNKKEFSGILRSFDRDTVKLTVDGSDMNLSRKNIANIRLSLDI